MVQASEAVRLTENSSIQSNAMSGGPGGDVGVSAPTVHLDNGTILARTIGNGDAGNVDVQGARVTLTRSAQVSTSSGTVSAKGRVDVGTGRAGHVTVTAETLTITDGRLSTETFGTGQAGDLTLNVGSLVAQGATLTSSSTGAATGTAGTVRIQGPGGLGSAATQVLLTGSTVATEATVADGGNIEVRAQTLLRLRDSQISTAVSTGQGQGGNIRIDPAAVILERSQIVANAFGGPGGNIQIVAQAFVPDARSQVSASSAQNVPGVVEIQAVTTPRGFVAPLPMAFAQTAELLRSRCAERLREGTVSRLVLGGRDGVPLEPGSLLLSPLQRVDQERGAQAGQRQPQPPALQPAWVSSVQAYAREGGQDECARWMGQPELSRVPKRHR
jgi:hypothetical protein